MKKFFLLASFLMASTAFSEEVITKDIVDEQKVEKPAEKSKVVSIDLVNASLQYMAGRKLSDVLNIFTDVKRLAENHLKAFPEAKEMSLPEKKIQAIMTLMRQEPMFQLYMGLQAAPYDQKDKPKK